MKILLDFDGVMVTTPVWQKVEHLDDGFMAFNESCVEKLADVLFATSADIVLTTTHRIHYNEKQWHQILYTRGVMTDSISKINQARTFTDLSIRCIEVLEWVTANPNENYVIIDDDKSLRDLPIEIKDRWVETKFHKGLTEKGSKQALSILLSND